MKNFIFICTIILGLLQAVQAQEGRSSITFVIGEDQSDDFFVLAKKYYLTNKSARTDYFVDTCSSMLAVREVLEREAENMCQAWGQINLVLHSNQWTGMSVPVMDGGERTTVESLFSYIQDETFAPLSDEILDEDTNMNFISCGLGKNKDLLYALQLAFGGFDEVQPAINSSEDFVYFSYDERQQVVSSTLKPFYAFYKTAYKPADLHLRKQLQARYPNVPIDWLAAMEKRRAHVEADAFHTKFNVPILWNVLVDEPAKDLQLNTEFEKLEFIRAQKDLMKLLDKYDIPIEKFRWQMKMSEKGEQTQVSIKGKSTVLCILVSV
jgi:hypothetical protein